MDKRTPDDIVTMVTQAPTHEAALAVMDSVRSTAALRAVADLLYVDAECHGAGWLRRAIADEARA